MREKYKSEKWLQQEYIYRQKSMQTIADELGVNLKTVQYWMDKHNIQRRNRSEATYVKRNPNGDPFNIKKEFTDADKILFFMTLGLYLGEGSKSPERCKVALGNSDPLIIRVFIRFLKELCGVKETKIKLELNIYNDINQKAALDYWLMVTELSLSNFYKPFVRESRKGSYKHWSRFGTLTVSVNNQKLFSTIMNWCEKYASLFSDVVGRANITCRDSSEVEPTHGKRVVMGSIPILGSRNFLDKNLITVFLNGRHYG